MIRVFAEAVRSTRGAMGHKKEKLCSSDEQSSCARVVASLFVRCQTIRRACRTHDKTEMLTTDVSGEIVSGLVRIVIRNFFTHFVARRILTAAYLALPAFTVS